MRKRTPYGLQLREKQKVKFMYGLLEKQFRRYVDTAMKSKENSGERLLVLLESRLDNVVYRLGFVPTRSAARQLVSHRKILVDGKKVNIPSYQMTAGKTVSLSEKALGMPVVQESLKDEGAKIPDWLERKAAVGRMKREPKREDITEAITEQDIIEFYSR